MVPQALKLTQTSNLIQSAPDAGYGSQHCRQGLKLGDVASDVTDGDPATLWLFTPLRVGWPPTPQVYFGP